MTPNSSPQVVSQIVPQNQPTSATVSAFLQLAPVLSSAILAIESAISQPKSGPSKLQSFINLSLGLFALGGPLAAAGIQQHDPQTIINLSTLFASAIIGGINQARSPVLTSNSSNSGQIGATITHSGSSLK